MPLVLNQSQDNGILLDMYDEFQLKTLDKNDPKYLWILLENPMYDGYIVRYERDLVFNNQPG